MSDEIVMDADDLLATIEHVEETLTVMSSVISHLKEQLITNLEQPQEISAEDFLERWDYSGLKPN